MGAIASPIKIYGYSPYTCDDKCNLYGRKIVEYAKRYKNITCVPWVEPAKPEIVKSSLYVYWAPAANVFELWYGLSLVEAVSLGIPVIAAKRDMQEQTWVIDGYNGFIVQSLNELTEKANMVMTNASILSNICINAKTHRAQLKNTLPIKMNVLYRYLLDGHTLATGFNELY